MTTPIRTLSTLAIGLALSALTAQAVPIGGLPDRDLVRNPYGSFGGSFGSSIVPQSGNIIGPNLGFASGITPPLFGGGGGGGGAFAFSSGAPSFGAGGIGGLGSNSNAGGGLPFILPPTFNGPSSLPFTAPYTTQTTIAITTQSVPEGGSSLILMGCGLLSLLALRRRMFLRKA